MLLLTILCLLSLILFDKLHPGKHISIPAVLISVAFCQHRENFLLFSLLHSDFPVFLCCCAGFKNPMEVEELG